MNEKPLPYANSIWKLDIVELEHLQGQIHQRLTALRMAFPGKPPRQTANSAQPIQPRVIPMAKPAPRPLPIRPVRAIPVMRSTKLKPSTPMPVPVQAAQVITLPAPPSSKVSGEPEAHLRADRKCSSLRSVEENEHFEGYYIVRKAVRQQRSDGATFWRITLADATGGLVCYAWPENVPPLDDIVEGSEVFVEVRTRIYKSRLIADILAMDLDVPPT